MMGRDCSRFIHVFTGLFVFLESLSHFLVGPVWLVKEKIINHDCAFIYITVTIDRPILGKLLARTLNWAINSLRLNVLQQKNFLLKTKTGPK